VGWWLFCGSVGGFCWLAGAGGFCVIPF